MRWSVHHAAAQANVTASHCNDRQLPSLEPPIAVPRRGSRGNGGSMSHSSWLLPGGGRAQGVHSGRSRLRAAAAAPGRAAGRGVQLAARPPRPPGGGGRVSCPQGPRCRRRLPRHPAAQVPPAIVQCNAAMLCSPLAGLRMQALPYGAICAMAEMRAPARAYEVVQTSILCSLLQRLRPGARADGQPAAAPAGRWRLPNRAN